MAGSTVATDYDPRFNPVYQRGHEDDAEEPPPAAIEPPASRIEPPPVIEPSPVIERSRDRRNPWLPILWTLALLVLALGLWAQWYSQKLFTSPNIDNVQDYYVIPNVLAELSPWFVIVGLASLVGVVFLHAVRWGNR